MNYESKSDSDLLTDFAANGLEAPFEELVRRHSALVFGVCQRVLTNRHDAEDAAQAVFLTLAHKAGLLRGRTEVGSWLHQVAWHVCVRAKRASVLRRAREQEAAQMAGRSETQLSWERFRPLLDEDLHALPEKYRRPLVLHHLEGWSEAETAKLLNCNPGTLSTRLHRGRELLRQRLARRGVGMSLVLLLTLLSENAKATAVPFTFAASTAKAAALIAAGSTTATGMVSAHVATLTKGVMKTMLISKLKAAALLVLAVCVAVGGTGVIILHALAAEPQPTAEKQKPIATPPMADNDGKPSVPTVKDGLSIPVKSDKAAASAEISWGQALNGIRLGLSPNVLTVGGQEREFKVRVWYENVSKEVKEVPDHKDVNMYRLMFAGEKNGTPFYSGFMIGARFATLGPRPHKLRSEERFSEEFTLSFDQNVYRFNPPIPVIAPNQAMSLRAGLCSYGDPSTEKDWNASDTLKSSAIKITRAGLQPFDPIRFAKAQTVLRVKRTKVGTMEKTMEKWGGDEVDVLAVFKNDAKETIGPSITVWPTFNSVIPVEECTIYLESSASHGKLLGQGQGSPDGVSHVGHTSASNSNVLDNCPTWQAWLQSIADGKTDAKQLSIKVEELSWYKPRIFKISEGKCVVMPNPNGGGDSRQKQDLNQEQVLDVEKLRILAGLTASCSFVQDAADATRKQRKDMEPMPGGQGYTITLSRTGATPLISPQYVLQQAQYELPDMFKLLNAILDRNKQ